MTNLFDLSFSVNKTLQKNPIINAEGNRSFSIGNPTCFCLMQLTESKMHQVTSILQKLELKYSATYLPNGYLKGQRSALYDVEVELGYSNKSFTVFLKEFGLSYGVIEFEGKEFNISHSFSSGSKDKPSLDFTTNWNIAGNAIEFIKLVEKKLTTNELAF